NTSMKTITAPCTTHAIIMMLLLPACLLSFSVLISLIKSEDDEISVEAAVFVSLLDVSNAVVEASRGTTLVEVGALLKMTVSLQKKSFFVEHKSVSM
ncbi:MAG: hypothetical protein AB2693_25555, partial [Candidatus Thiodiazotropha sp.]